MFSGSEIRLSSYRVQDMAEATLCRGTGFRVHGEIAEDLDGSRATMTTTTEDHEHTGHSDPPLNPKP